MTTIAPTTSQPSSTSCAPSTLVDPNGGVCGQKNYKFVFLDHSIVATATIPQPIAVDTHNTICRPKEDAYTPLTPLRQAAYNAAKAKYQAGLDYGLSECGKLAQQHQQPGREQKGLGECTGCKTGMS